MVEVVKYAGTGRRKSSVARVVLTPGEGKISVNKREFNDYFPRETDRINIMQPLKLVNLENKFDIFVRVTGGGATGQAGAFRHVDATDAEHRQRAHGIEATPALDLQRHVDPVEPGGGKRRVVDPRRARVSNR